MEIRSLPFIARPTPVRVGNLLRLIEEFLSTPSPPASLWHQLLGHLSSLTLLVSGGMLRMRLLQLCLKDQWRQYHHSRLSPSFRRDVLLLSERRGEGNPPMGGHQPFPSPASVPHGLVQCHSGRSESSQSGDWVRVDSPSGGSRSPCPQMAGSDRSFCDVPDRQTSCVLLPGLRFEGGRDGRSSPALRQSPGLCLSSDRHYKESSCQTEVFKGL